MKKECRTAIRKQFHGYGRKVPQPSAKPYAAEKGKEKLEYCQRNTLPVSKREQPLKVFSGKTKFRNLILFFPSCLVSLSPPLLSLTAISSMHLCDEYTAVNLSLDLIVIPPLLLNYPLNDLSQYFHFSGSQFPKGLVWLISRFLPGSWVLWFSYY